MQQAIYNRDAAIRERQARRTADWYQRAPHPRVVERHPRPVAAYPLRQQAAYQGRRAARVSQTQRGGVTRRQKVTASPIDTIAYRWRVEPDEVRDALGTGLVIVAGIAMAYAAVFVLNALHLGGVL